MKWIKSELGIRNMASLYNTQKQANKPAAAGQRRAGSEAGSAGRAAAVAEAVVVDEEQN